MKRSTKFFFVPLALIAVLAVSLVGTLLIRRDANAAPASACTWKVVSSPSVNNLNNQLNSIAAISATNVWAVGYTLSNYNEQRSLVEHWNGTKWIIVATPKLHANASPLYSVSADAANDVWAVGYVGKSRQSSNTLIEHWNGTQWSVVPSANTGYIDVLYGVTAMTPDNVWAVGSYNNEQDVLIEHWDGTQWSIVPGVSPGDSNNLNSIAAISANDIWAVGYSLSSTSEGTLTEHWDGTQWSVVSSASVRGNGSYLLSVSASATNNVWAVGYVTNYDQTLIERWDGTKWSLVPGIPPSSKNEVQLNGVIALSSSNVWMAGYTGLEAQTLIGRWNGTKWSKVSSPSPGTQNNDLQAIASVPGTNQLWAVGFLFDPSSRFTKTLIESYC